MKTKPETKIIPRKKATKKDIQFSNAQVEKSYNTIIKKAMRILQRFEEEEFRTYCQMDHTKNEQNTNMVKEFLCYFWNITLSKNSKSHCYYIYVDLGKEGLNQSGNVLMNLLLPEMYSVFFSSGQTNTAVNWLIINFTPLQLSNYYYNTIARGETDYVAISSVEHAME